MWSQGNVTANLKILLSLGQKHAKNKHNMFHGSSIIIKTITEEKKSKFS